MIKLKKILLNPNDIKVSPKQIIIGVLSIIVIATIIAVIIPEETETTNTNTTTNNNPQFSKEEQQNANDYIITMEATGLIKEIKTVCDDGSKGCFYFLIDENLWNNYTNYYVETSFRDIYNGGALVEAFIIKTEK